MTCRLIYDKMYSRPVESPDIILWAFIQFESFCTCQANQNHKMAISYHQILCVLFFVFLFFNRKFRSYGYRALDQWPSAPYLLEAYQGQFFHFQSSHMSLISRDAPDVGFAPKLVF